MSGGGGQGVPSVVGLDRAAATTAITQAHLKIVFDPSAPSSEPAGLVASQNPAGGVKIHGNSTVHVVLSSGPDLIGVPSVRGLSDQDARTRLLGAKLRIAGEREQVDNSIGQGQVVGTEPAAGAKVASGSSVTILLSAGSDQIKVPGDLIGQDFDAAAAELQGKGLQVSRQDIDANNVDPGQVAQSTPRANQPINRGGTVTLFVAKDFGDILGGNPTGDQVRIPTDLQGKTGRAAQAELEGSGLHARIVGRKDAHVLVVSPGEGSQTAKGSTVTLYTVF
jgi:beta-lactam-binding protein with PASTA domain